MVLYIYKRYKYFFVEPRNGFNLFLVPFYLVAIFVPVSNKK